MTYIPGNSDARFVTYGQNIGNGSAGPYTFTHSLGTQALYGLVRDNLTGAMNIVDVRPNPTARLTQAIVDTTETWATNAKHLTVFGVLGVGDVTAPTQPTIGFTSKTDTTITVSASGSTDAVGISYYDYYIGAVKVGSQQGASFTYTGLTQSTAYATLNVIAVDIEGNPSVASSNLASVTTNPTLTRQATGTGGRNTTAATTITTTGSVTTPSSLSSSVMLVPVTISHANWLNMSATSGAGSITLSSSNGGAFTQVTGSLQYQGPSGQQTGHVVWFSKNSPASGAHTLTATAVSPGAAIDEICIGAPLVYSGVASLGTPVLNNNSGSSSPVAATVTSRAGDMVVALVGASAAVTGLTGTNLSNAGTAVNGTCDYTYVQEIPGAGTSVTVSSTSSQSFAISVIDLVRP